MRTENLALLKQFIENHFYLDVKDVEVETLLERDLRITGDDAVEFILAFGREFDVDVSHFKLDEYFEAEGVLGPFFFSSFYRYAVSPEKKKMTIGDLLDAMEKHVL